MKQKTVDLYYNKLGFNYHFVCNRTANEAEMIVGLEHDMLHFIHVTGKDADGKLQILWPVAEAGRDDDVARVKAETAAAEVAEAAPAAADADDAADDGTVDHDLLLSCGLTFGECVDAVNGMNKDHLLAKVRHRRDNRR